jgi:AcrR family transcriptional regulator
LFESDRKAPSSGFSDLVVAVSRGLAGRYGYHSVSMADIGTEAGITGSGIHRHFDSKASILVALFERVIDDLLQEQDRIIDSEPSLHRVLDLLIAGQVEFVVGDRPSRGSITTRSPSFRTRTGPACVEGNACTWRNGCTSSVSSDRLWTTPTPAPSCTPP